MITTRVLDRYEAMILIESCTSSRCNLPIAQLHNSSQPPSPNEEDEEHLLHGSCMRRWRQCLCGTQVCRLGLLRALHALSCGHRELFCRAYYADIRDRVSRLHDTRDGASASVHDVVSVRAQICTLWCTSRTLYSNREVIAAPLKTSHDTVKLCTANSTRISGHVGRQFRTGGINR